MLQIVINIDRLKSLSDVLSPIHFRYLTITTINEQN